MLKISFHVNTFIPAFSVKLIFRNHYMPIWWSRNVSDIRVNQGAFLYLCDGVDGVPALAQHLSVGVIHETHEPWQQCACVSAVVQPCAGEIAVKDGDGGLSEPSVRSSRRLQQIFNDDPLTHFILHWQNHRLTVAQFLNSSENTFILSVYWDLTSLLFLKDLGKHNNNY